MNNYKFRGKECWLDDDGKKIFGKWVYGYLMDADKICPPKIDLTAPDFFDLIDFVAPETVGQWTGKTGMQNIELYSGDIIEYNGQDFPDAVGRCAVITYDKDLARFVAGLGKNGIGPNLWHECKKLGNIHDNPELLGGK